MEQFNPNTYKKQSTAQQFTGSCLGKMTTSVILAASSPMPTAWR